MIPGVWHQTWITAAFLVVLAALVLVAPGVAYADGVFPFTGHSPAGPGGTATLYAATVAVYADSDVQFPASDPYYLITIDGVPYPTYAEYLGHWEDDGCETWFVVEDYTVMRLVVYTNLTDGPHTVTARFRDSAGKTDETTWTFVMASAPTVTGNTPLLGTSSTRPTIRARVADYGTSAPTVVMRLDGAVVPASFSWPSGDLAYTPSAPLSDNAMHTVEVEATDVAGNRTVFPWSFVVKTSSAATWTNPYPGAGQTISASGPTVRVTAATPAALRTYWWGLHIDGAYHSTTYSMSGPNQVTLYATTSSLADGPHSVRARVADVNNIESEYTWDFNVAILPTINYQTPTPNTAVHVPRPQISFGMGDNTPGPLHAVMIVDGVTVVDATLSQGWVRWTPTSDYANPSTHRVTAIVTDAAGNMRTYAWTFTVASIPGMSTADDCTGCHDITAHSVSDCAGCHVSVAGYDEHGGSPVAPLGACWECHGGEGGHGPELLGGCAGCHTGYWSHIPAVHSAEYYTPLHTTSTAGCTECHDASLITEHAKYPADDIWHKYQCALCHRTADADVQAAVTAGTTACADCHEDVTHRGLHEPDGASGTCFNGVCHGTSANLMDVHASLAGPGSAHPEFATACELCHENPAVDTRTSGTACTGSCHPGTLGRVPRPKSTPPGR